MIKAFISHSSKDKPFVRKLKEDLNFNGIETWVDEDELTPGDKLYDTLILALQSSSHFLIVLSNNIKTSHWVDTEINEAISSLDKKIIKKIIPVLFRKTEIPESLEGLFYANFSDIVFVLKGDSVSFTGDKYHTELKKIINAVSQSKEYALSTSEKSNIVEKTKTAIPAKKQLTNVVGLYEIVGFASTESRKQFVIDLKNKFKSSPISQLSSVIPVILPALLKPIFANIRLGDKITFVVTKNKFITAHFCGFSNNNTRIVLAAEVRKAFGITKRKILSVGFDGSKREIVLFM